MIDQDQSKYEVVAYRRPRRGELYFFHEHVNQAGSSQRDYPCPVHIVKLREPSAPVINYAALLKQFFDAEGNSSTNTFYDADLAARFYGRP